MNKLIYLGLCACLLFGCTNKYRMKDVTGVGRLDLPAMTWKQLTAFAASPGAMYMSVDPQSGGTYFARCPEAPCIGGDTLRYVIDRCSSKYNGQCKLLSAGRQIAWDGPIYVADRLVWTPEIGRQTEITWRHAEAIKRKRLGIILNILYQATDRSSASKWRRGTAWMRQSSSSPTLFVELEGSATCDVSLMPETSSSGRVTPLKGAIKGECFDNAGAKLMSLEGHYESKKPFNGVVKATDQSGRKLEIWYKRRITSSLHSTPCCFPNPHKRLGAPVGPRHHANASTSLNSSLRPIVPFTDIQ